MNLEEVQSLSQFALNHAGFVHLMVSPTKRGHAKPAALVSPGISLCVQSFGTSVTALVTLGRLLSACRAHLPCGTDPINLSGGGVVLVGTKITGCGLWRLGSVRLLHQAGLGPGWIPAGSLLDPCFLWELLCRAALHLVSLEGLVPCSKRL